MKLIMILLLIISCGKHEQPGEQDLSDHDGDHVANYLESKDDLFFADVSPLSNLQVELSFRTSTQKHVVMLTNETSFKNYSNDMMVKNLKLFEEDYYFSEFTTLRTKEKDEVLKINTKGLTRISLAFNDVASRPQHLYLREGERFNYLGPWKRNMDLVLKDGQLAEILSGKAMFIIDSLDLKRREDIKLKTRRYIVSSNESSEIYYISRKLSLSDVLVKLNIRDVKDIESYNLLTDTFGEDENSWWLRDTGETVILVKDNLKSLAEHFFVNWFNATKHVVMRTNGISIERSEILKHMDAKMLLKVRAHKTMVNFNLSRNEIRHNNSFCTNYRRDAQDPYEVAVTFEEIAEALDLKRFQRFSKKEVTDELGKIWEIEIIDSTESIAFAFNNLQSNLYVQTGIYHSICHLMDEPAKIPNLQTPERSFTLEIEAFVEKI